MAKTVWVLASVGHASPAFFDAIAEAAKVLLKDFKFQHHVQTECAFVTLSHASPALCDAIADAA
eukprot:2175867-Karenia_brevis.AAC.1